VIKRHRCAILCFTNLFFCRVAFSQEARHSLIEFVLLLGNGIALNIDALMDSWTLFGGDFLAAPIKRIIVLLNFKPRRVLTLIRVGSFAVWGLVDDHRDVDHVRREAFSLPLHRRCILPFRRVIRLTFGAHFFECCASFISIRLGRIGVLPWALVFLANEVFKHLHIET
jgi:hypothetical protein